MSELQSMQTEAERLFESAADSLSDDIVGRLGSNMGEGLMLLDQISRSNLDKAIPLIDHLVETGDLERATNLLRVLGSAGDAISDDIVGRLGEMANELMIIADRVARNENIHKLLDLLERDYMIDMLTSLCEAAASAKASHDAPPSGGIMGLLKTMKDPEVQQAIQLMSKFSAGFKNG
ncbi:MAG: DUF1641 domain-containing protein [Gammaproteobacteria bacterium]